MRFSRVSQTQESLFPKVVYCMGAITVFHIEGCLIELNSLPDCRRIVLALPGRFLRSYCGFAIADLVGHVAMPPSRSLDRQ